MDSGTEEASRPYRPANVSTGEDSMALKGEKSLVSGKRVCTESVPQQFLIAPSPGVGHNSHRADPYFGRLGWGYPALPLT